MGAILLGFSSSFLGSLPLGIISVLVMEIAATRTWQAAAVAALGVSVVEMGQSFLAVYGAGLFVAYPFLKTVLAGLGLPIFLILALQHLNHSGEVGKKTIGSRYSPFWQGALVSSLNMAAIPYWILWGGVFLANGWVENTKVDIGIFAIGTGLGTCTAMLLYIFVGILFKNQLQRYNLFVNRGIGLLFLAMAGLQLKWLLSSG